MWALPCSPPHPCLLPQHRAPFLPHCCSFQLLAASVSPGSSQGCMPRFPLSALCGIYTWFSLHMWPEPSSASRARNLLQMHSLGRACTHVLISPPVYDEPLLSSPTVTPACPRGSTPLTTQYFPNLLFPVWNLNRVPATATCPQTKAFRVARSAPRPRLCSSEPCLLLFLHWPKPCPRAFTLVCPKGCSLCSLASFRSLFTCNYLVYASAPAQAGVIGLFAQGGPSPACRTGSAYSSEYLLSESQTPNVAMCWFLASPSPA